MLSTNLKSLEENLLIERTVYDEVPVKVHYTPTPYAKTLEKVLMEMIEWGKLHKNTIKKSRTF